MHCKETEIWLAECSIVYQLACVCFEILFSTSIYRAPSTAQSPRTRHVWVKP